jgi:hypothetical protein
VLLRHIPDFCLQYDQALRILRLEWVSGADVRGLRTSARKLLALMEELPVHHLLLDMNTVPDLPLADQLWLGKHWMPGLVASPLARLVLAIDGNRIHNQLAIDALHDLVQPAIRFESHYFSDSASAFDWLADGSEQLPALVAEWDARHASATPFAVG